MQKKFNINERLKKLPYEEAVLLRRKIALIIGRTREYVSRIINASEDSKKDFPSEVVIKLSKYFDCKPQDLFNTPPEPISKKELKNLSKTKKSKKRDN